MSTSRTVSVPMTILSGSMSIWDSGWAAMSPAFPPSATLSMYWSAVTPGARPTR